MRVSHETIYRSLFIQARGMLKKELLGHLRSKRRIRRSQHSRVFKDSRGQIVDAISIRQRPAEIEDRAVPGRIASRWRTAFSSHLVSSIKEVKEKTLLPWPEFFLPSSPPLGAGLFWPSVP
jgi:hypothetical protein